MFQYGESMNNRIKFARLALLLTVCLIPVTPLSAQQKQNEVAPPKKQSTKETKTMTDPPIACNLLGLTASERQRQQALHKQLFSRLENVEELADGYAVAIPDTKENILAAAEFISLERVCCSFFHFEMAVGQPGEPVWLRLTGGEGVKDFLKTQFKLK